MRTINSREINSCIEKKNKKKTRINKFNYKFSFYIRKNCSNSNYARESFKHIVRNVRVEDTHDQSMT